MNRPFAGRLGIVVLLGLAGAVAGCKKESKDTGPDTPPPPPGSGAVVPPGGAGGPPSGSGKVFLPPNAGPSVAGDVNRPPTQQPQPRPPQSAATTPAPAGGTEVAVSTCNSGGVEDAIAAARGKVVLIDCWATWCGPCVASFPKLVEKHHKYGPRGLAVISLSTDRQSDSPKVIDFLRRQNATFTNLHMPLDGAAQKWLQNKFAYRNAIPHAVLFDKSGQRVWAGHPMDRSLEQRIEAELAK